MKVLKKGREPQDWSKTCICTGEPRTNRGCGAVLLVQHSDLFRDSWKITFQCPECKKLNYIEIELDFNIDAMSLPAYADWKKRTSAFDPDKVID